MTTYCELDDVRVPLGLTSRNRDVDLAAAIVAASRQIDGYCDRRFYADGTATARVFVPSDHGVVDVDDFGTLDGLVVEAAASQGVWSEVSGFQVEPLNGIVGGQTWAYSRLRAISEGWPCRYGEATVRVTADWGWPAVPDAVREACRVQTVAIFKSPESPFGVAGAAEFGVLRVSQMHPTAQSLLAPYRRTVAV